MLDDHQREIVENINLFCQSLKLSKTTKSNLNSFVGDIFAIDSLGLTQFELSFKFNKAIKDDSKMRLLNLDSKAYSYRNKGAYLKRLDSYFDIFQKNNINLQLDTLHEALKSVSDDPMDVYIGADIENEDYQFAIWLILGGALRSGKINLKKNSVEIIDKLFKRLGFNPSFEITQNILNIGFDIDNNDLYYKIYYFLNKDNYHQMNSEERRIVGELIGLLKSEHKYWFFASERYKKGGLGVGRKKLYLEFLDDLYLNKKETLDLIEEILTIMRCEYNKETFRDVFRGINARLVILAIEDDGVVTFYIRL
ncbi:hypothetical protein L6270_00255 [Candidatus Parcubacteria bacterium]|nr:hypothetical protein [Patescibacteria group bacterium]MBU4309580.1 hypothetical protein [Patescibacteria group bacterium]MBU4432265.1 hypothetical protein [Patescibacteria group bacterium]MBU4578032.1 hypothetical protein [Patescibacteria group bacterium]MCG2696460.1 hypothetical protein [Candidatus Parcubacteria bacterium]